jgi:hypothetical protein
MRDVLGAVALVVALATPATAGWHVVAWNDLGMHCMDADYSVFSILPPYNNLHAQLIDPNGNLITNPTGFTVTYQAVADADGSINSTSAAKTDFWVFVHALFGVSPAPDTGLAGNSMPGAGNTPQIMAFNATGNYFDAEGVPMTPYDDAGRKNTYPMVRVIARDSGGTVLATTDVVLPVSDEMDCRTCHASGSDIAAEPAEGWVNDCQHDSDYRLNILRLHDDTQGGTPAYIAALAAAGYEAAGLYATAAAGTPVLCARCHASNALPGTGLTGIPPLTQSVHGYHASVVDPVTGETLDSATNRSACYRCHPGSQTRCLRGVMGNSVAPDGTLAVQCQNCHGVMSVVGSPSRQGWFDEPNCQNCHTGTATQNNGQIRYTTVFDTNGQPRVPVNLTFATTPNTPAPGISLYRFSQGHGGLQCEACHGATHAEYASSHQNDNAQSIAVQGHVGTLAECDACHGSQPATTFGGPHGMHPVGQGWVGSHGDIIEQVGVAACQPCHGTDYRGTVLSRAAADRQLSRRTLWRGEVIGCYDCHNGPGGEGGAPTPPTASGGSAATAAYTPVAVTLPASDPNGYPISYRIVHQPSHGTVALTGNQATFYPEPGYVGTDAFSFAAADTYTSSNLASFTLETASRFADVPEDGFASFVERLYSAGVTAGCSVSPLDYCPSSPVSRAEMAVFIEVGIHGTAYQPPPATGLFGDVPPTSPYAPWIEQFARDGITAGCGNGNYCPNENVTRAQMAVFLLRATHPARCVYSEATGNVFADVPATYWAAGWIEQFARERITAGCGNGLYCPDSPVRRNQMAVFLVTAFRLP